MSIQERELPKTLNSLMKHLRDGGIAIDGSAQKRRLKNIGYYHGYKGYRFAGNASNRLPLTDFSQVAALYDFDTQLKALFLSSHHVHRDGTEELHARSCSEGC